MINLNVFFKEQLCGVLTKHSENSYSFVYDESYLSSPGARPVSVNLPLRAKSYNANALFSAFDNLISEGWLLEAQIAQLKIDKRNRFALIQRCGMECCGAVSFRSQND